MKRKRPFSHAEHAAYRDTLRGFREVLLGGSESTLPEPVDSRSSVEEDYQRLILDDLLYFFPGPYIMLAAYLDESGTHDDSPAMCVAGLLYTADAMKQLDQEWKVALDRTGIRTAVS